MIQNQVTEPNERTPEEIEAENLDELLTTRCRWCGRKISLLNCSWDGLENAICAGGSCR
jgi:hypothetical protein